ncbi:MAG: hypothetical protein II381_03170, partial [Victivallales bacterium]|nr:hypothetical protein [Victivallales bacterium]
MWTKPTEAWEKRWNRMAVAGIRPKSPATAICLCADGFSAFAGLVFKGGARRVQPSSKHDSPTIE